MAGITDLPYRLIMKRFGAGLVFTEMVSANGLFFNGAATRELLRSVPEEHPLGIQLFGESADRLAAAAAEVSSSCDLIDINLGCPVRKVTRSGAGSALLNDPLKIGQILAEVRKATRLPLTIKLRSGWDHNHLSFLEIAHIAVEEGVDAMTLHPRTRCQGFSGKADLDHIRQLRQNVRIPIIGSGDIFTADGIKTMFKETGCDAVMIGRGGYGNPWLIPQGINIMADRPIPQPDTGDRYRVASEHLELFLETFGPRKTLGHMRKHLCWYVRGLENSAGFRSRINGIGSVEEMRIALAEFFMEAA
jgi:nifR3 family TIM-barrel protein